VVVEEEVWSEGVFGIVVVAEVETGWVRMRGGGGGEPLIP
jgi:hypothetical protein